MPTTPKPSYRPDFAPGVVRLPIYPNHKPFHIEPWITQERYLYVIAFKVAYGSKLLFACHEVERKWHVSERKFHVPDRKIFATHSKQKRSAYVSERNRASTAFS